MSTVAEPVAVHPDGEWIDLVHADTGGRTRIPNDATVLDAHTAKGWAIAPAEEPPAVVTAPAPLPDEAWIEMVHPDFPGSQRLPNNPPALAGAREKGWITVAEASAVDTESLTVKEVLELVDGDPVKAESALAAERAGKNRTSLISALEAVAAPSAVQSTDDVATVEEL